MKISKRNLSRLIESLLWESEFEMSLKDRAFEEIDSLAQKDKDLLDNSLSNVGHDYLDRPKIDLSKIRNGEEIPLKEEEVRALDELIAELSEFIKIYLNSNEEHITGYIKEITPVLGKGTKEWFKDGQWHREGDKPAYVQYREDGSIWEELWCKNGEYHREGDKPATISYYTNGKFQSRRWMKDGKENREGDKPSYIYNRPDGTIEVEQWHKDGKRHREGDKPAAIEYRKDGSIIEENWFKDGKRHREGDKPASIEYYEDGLVWRRVWYKDGNYIRSKEDR